MNPIELGKFLANLRNEKNLTQEELADRLYIDKRKISRWECGTSTPEFDMLIKLSEILDVSLYELSICKRLDKEKLSRKTLNKFKSIKDFKKYKLKKKVLIFIYIIFFIIFGITLSYTIRNNGSVEIYELKSLDENYYLRGNLVIYKDNNILNIATISSKNMKQNFNKSNCTVEIINKSNRVIKIHKENKTFYPFNQYYYNGISIINDMDISKELNMKVICNSDNELNDESFVFKFHFVKIYDNKLFSF